MSKLKALFIGISLLVKVFALSQSSLKGHVSDKQGNSLFAVNVYLSDQNSKGTSTDLDGNFSLILDKTGVSKDEQLVFSFVGYKQQIIKLDSNDFKVPIMVVLEETTQNLNEVVIEARKSISKEFSIKEMDKLKIYLNPMASADPLKAIASLPSSTNTNETANPELRGSDANRTKVFFNGVPISNPVRNSQLNGIGFFSIFNTQLINSLLVYPSNPPLIYGNTSAGAIEIETDEKIESNNYQITASLASTGAFVSKKINDKGFIQIYGNLMFSQGFLSVNSDVHEYLKSFSSNDAGLNYHYKFSETTSLNFYNYLVSESSNVLLNLFTWQDIAKASTLRDFSVLNFKYNKLKHFFSVNAGTNFSKSNFLFGNMKSAYRQQGLYLSANYKYFYSENLSVQAGLSQEYGSFHFKDEVPLYYFALSPNSPSIHYDSVMTNNLPEMYLYLRWKPFSRMILGAGIRKNLNFFHSNDPNYLSGQVNSKYNFLEKHSLLLSAGRYNCVTEPIYSQREFRLLISNQVAAEYLFESKNTTINLATYYKSESGDTTGIKNIKGFEIYVEQYFLKYLKASISNTFLNSEISELGSSYNSDNNVGYFLISTISFDNPKLFSLSVSWSNRKGKLYTPVISAYYNPSVDFYQPILSNEMNSKRFGDYNTINLALSKMFSIPKHQLIAFFSVFNLLNSKNQQSLVYNKDYSNYSYDYYQGRSIYFGFVINSL